MTKEMIEESLLTFDIVLVSLQITVVIHCIDPTVPINFYCCSFFWKTCCCGILRPMFILITIVPMDDQMEEFRLY